MMIRTEEEMLAESMSAEELLAIRLQIVRMNLDLAEKAASQRNTLTVPTCLRLACKVLVEAREEYLNDIHQ